MLWFRTATIFTWRFRSCPVWLAPLGPLHVALPDVLGWSERLWRRCFCSSWAGAGGCCHSLPPHYVQEGCSAHSLSMSRESSFHLKSETCDVYTLICDAKLLWISLSPFTFFFCASIALRFSSSFILSWIISEAMRCEGSLGEGDTGEGDVIGRGGVEIWNQM